MSERYPVEAVEDPCDGCQHSIAQHSRELGVGCLHVNWMYGLNVKDCPCLEPGTSEADQ